VTRPKPDRRRVLALVVIFATGLVLGAIGSDLRAQVADRSAAGGQPNLVAGSFAWPPRTVSEWTISELAARGEFAVLMHNLGESAVTVIAARPHGWTPIGNAEIGTRVPAGEWARVPLIARPDCAESARPEIELVVRNRDGDQDITVASPGPVDLAEIHRTECQLPASSGLAVDTVGLVVHEHSTLRMQLSLRHPGVSDADEITVTRLVAEWSGFRAVGAGLPVELRPDDGKMTVELAWTIADCDLAANLADMPLTVEVTGPESVAGEHRLQLPARGVAALARFSAVTCSSSR
jgi:hypothetical protein